MDVYKGEFHFCHGRDPRGDGIWAFAENGATPSDKLFWFRGLYSDAKRAAIAHAKAVGWTRLEVRP